MCDVVLKGHSAFESGFFGALSVFGSFTELHNAHQLTFAVLIRSALWIYSSFHGQQCTQTGVMSHLET